MANLPGAQRLLRSRCVHPRGEFIEFPPEAVARTITARFEEQVRRYPDRVAVRTRMRTLTYAQLNEAANRVAHALLARPEWGGGAIALLLEHGTSFVVASLGALKAGRIQVTLDCTFPPARLELMLGQSQSAALVTNRANLPLARRLGGLPVLDIDEPTDRLPCSNPGLAVPPDACVSVAYTSGSTGEPKGIVWNHRCLLHAVMRHTSLSRMCAHDRLVMFRPALRGYLYALLNGAAFYPVDLQREALRDIADWLIEEDVTVFRTAVSTFRTFVDALGGAEAFAHLRLILVLGEQVYRTDVERYRKHFPAGCLFASTLGCSEFDDYAYFFVDQGSGIRTAVVPGGYTIGDTEIVFLGEDGKPVDDGEIGEIVIRSRYNAAGYWRRPDLEEAAFLPDPAGGDARLYRTGDLGRRDPDGCIHHLGRTDFQVKIRGHRVEVAEVEAALLEQDDVAEAVVVAREDTPGERQIVAYVTAAGRQAPTVGRMRRMLCDQLPEPLVPSVYVVLETLPRTANGKVDRRALPRPEGVRPALETPFVAPRTPVEERLAATWAGVLGLDRVGVHDSFLDLGGDSLLATRVISRVQEHAQVRLPLRALLASLTVAEMAEVVERGEAGPRRRAGGGDG